MARGWHGWGQGRRGGQLGDGGDGDGVENRTACKFLVSQEKKVEARLTAAAK